MPRFSMAQIKYLLLAVAVLFGTLWLLGIKSMPPRFVIDRSHPGRIQPMNDTLLRQIKDGLHRRKYIALTFDDGPAEHSVNQNILKALDKHHARVVFFLICRNINSREAMDDIRAALAAGHKVGNHTVTHQHLPRLDNTTRLHEIADCRQTLEAATGTKVTWFRPPFGDMSPQVQAEVENSGAQIVMWEANSADTWQRTIADIRDFTLKEAHDGAILLMHSGKLTAEALDSILTSLEEQGYQFILPEA
ncbi:MAG: polysaccharide deacetylase family protein [Rhodocyclaceae bacterium]|nr:polysaccharide deacetylase family protein [Rhodocyclaceae bacterium]